MRKRTSVISGSCFGRSNRRKAADEESLDEPPQTILDDLYFVCVASLDERQTRWWERIMTYLERAYWRYDDHWRKMYPNLKKMRSMKEFAKMMFERVENLQPHLSQFDEIFRSWTAYKRSIRQSGAILLNENMDKVLLVKGPGSMPWGVPKGKCEKQEVLQPHLAAIREVREETGFDITNYLQHKHTIIRRQGRGSYGGDLVMYVILNVPEDYPFDSECKAEVASLSWHCIDQLPTNRSTQERIKDLRSGKEVKYGRGLRSLVEPLKKWIRKFKLNPGMDNLVETSVEENATNDELDDPNLPQTSNNGDHQFSTQVSTEFNADELHFDAPQLIINQLAPQTKKNDLPSIQGNFDAPQLFFNQLSPRIKQNQTTTISDNLDAARPITDKFSQQTQQNQENTRQDNFETPKFVFDQFKMQNQKNREIVSCDRVHGSQRMTSAMFNLFNEERKNKIMQQVQKATEIWQNFRIDNDLVMQRIDKMRDIQNDRRA